MAWLYTPSTGIRELARHCVSHALSLTPEELVAEAGDKPGFVAAGFDWRGVGAFDERARRAGRVERPAASISAEMDSLQDVAFS